MLTFQEIVSRHFIRHHLPARVLLPSCAPLRASVPKKPLHCIMHQLTNPQSVMHKVQGLVSVHKEGCVILSIEHAAVLQLVGFLLLARCREGGDGERKGKIISFGKLNGNLFKPSKVLI